MRTFDECVYLANRFHQYHKLFVFAVANYVAKYIVDYQLDNATRQKIYEFITNDSLSKVDFNVNEIIYIINLMLETKQKVLIYNPEASTPETSFGLTEAIFDFIELYKSDIDYFKTVYWHLVKSALGDK